MTCTHQLQTTRVTTHKYTAAAAVAVSPINDNNTASNQWCYKCTYKSALNSGGCQVFIFTLVLPHCCSLVIVFSVHCILNLSVSLQLTLFFTLHLLKTVTNPSWQLTALGCIYTTNRRTSTSTDVNLHYSISVQPAVTCSSSQGSS